MPERPPVAILGVPMDLGQDRRGVDMGPSAIRYARLQPALEELGYRVSDLGNVEVPIPEAASGGDGKAWRLRAVREVCSAVSRRAREAVARGALPVFLGGDHSISIGTVSGVCAAGRTGVLWVDAHADFNTPESSPSGNIHGMPLAALTGRGHPDLVGVGGEGASVRPEDAVLVGLRSVDREERDLLREAGVRVYTMKDIDAYGVAAVVRRALEHLSGLPRLHLSLDLDVVDPEVAPGVGTPVRGGLTYREAHLLMELVNEAGGVSSLDVVEVNPILDSRNRTAELAVELVASLMGRQILELPRRPL
ncbi:arginase [Rubrobacter xylanophilus DSM 9941]|uniref:Arginase n=1 Tax=Rubrobacter xylanophilus (strain DSM 9941 / JCM 11954 / NBRC 16129 / PRD-1) TaxID=266117 RepID=Q1AWJ4_RUBXD|nr:arginase [Rubrobacter xylanophilus]ABG04234.1 arginase [Rubrobacter xylanophilus DSM 9941]